MPSGRAVMAADPVIAAGIGVRLGRGFAVRAGSFRLTGQLAGQSVLGVVIRHPAQATAIIDLLAGVARPAYGELRVLGHDMATVRGRAAVRRRVGVARRSARSLPWLRVRGLVTHGARLAAAAVHQPELLLLDGLLDGLSQRDAVLVSKAVRELAEECAVLIAGCDGEALMLACDEVLVLTDGVLVPAAR